MIFKQKAILFLGLCATAVACTSESQKQAERAALNERSSDSTSAANLTAVAHQPQIDTSANDIGTDKSGGLLAKGVKLINASDCTSCHKEKELLVGPAYKDVAKRYTSTDANITALATKIIKGGQGNWGQVPMTPHPDLSVEDAKEMVKYILTVK
ncbi:c-type cytochrome [Hymenobacter cavernae]|uniref:Cytochrome c domain-containing protein n=1 Tax=Hymenobacter cavernae TaxID=2044852 RepID=A0ABQ1U7N0_9BACT|nr:c-type cytochrome [Hymenobacter cavernae]GGF10845.1 hypothetical protein GCM10011383_22580 [Hymenobacter cavernae]